MKKGDFIIIASVLIIASALLFAVKFSFGNKKTVVISENNKEIYSVPLSTDKTFKLKGNTVEIKNGKVKVINADCKNQICVNHKSICEKGESIVCLPNRVIVQIK